MLAFARSRVGAKGCTDATARGATAMAVAAVAAVADRLPPAAALVAGRSTSKQPAAPATDDSPAASNPRAVAAAAAALPGAPGARAGMTPPRARSAAALPRAALWTHATVAALLGLLALLLAAAWRLGELTRGWPLLLLPVALAPFVEFGLHRFVLHARLPSRDGLRRRLQVALHHAHHAEPRRIDRLFWPAWALLVLGPAVYAGYALVFGAARALVPMAASVGYFVFYEWMHFSHHDPGYLPRTRYGRSLRKAHMHHHYHDAERWWGITNDLADRLFGTGGGRDPARPPRSDPRQLR